MKIRTHLYQRTSAPCPSSLFRTDVVYSESYVCRFTQLLFTGDLTARKKHQLNATWSKYRLTARATAASNPVATGN